LDKVFSKAIKKQFEFDDLVATVFDDMASRSIPFYKENIELITTFLSSFLNEGAKVADLGCSTASTLIALSKKCNFPLKLLGVDSAKSMIEIAKSKAKAYGVKIEFLQEDILLSSFTKCDAVIANYTLQFIRPPKRAVLVKKIYDSLNENGVFIFSEKILYNENRLDKIMIDYYLDFKKRNGYSEFEISQKREALENVLIPYSEKENYEMVLEAGFNRVETVFKWANFATFVAFKT